MKQTDYDKALQETIARINDERHRWSMEDAVDFAFKQGYEYGRKQFTTDHERNLIALGDDYMTARNGAMSAGFYKLCKIQDDADWMSYRDGWKDADTFEKTWFDSLMTLKSSSQCENCPILNGSERVTTQKSSSEQNREKCQNPTICDFRKDKSLMRYEIATQIIKSLAHRLRMEYGDGSGWSGDFTAREIAQHSVSLTDVLIAELEKTEQ